MAKGKPMLLKTLALAAAPLLGLGLAQGASADAVTDFYKDRDLTIMIGHPPGGSYDLYAQLAAAHFGKHVPGNPNVIVQHMPGGGGSKATAYFFHKAPHDGSVVGIFPETIAHTQLMDTKRGKWDVRKMKYVGGFASVNPVFMVRKGAPAMSVDAMRATQTNVGCSGKTSQSFQMPAMLKNYAGLKLNLICGYKGSAAYILAMTRGEVDMVSSAWNAWRAKHKDAIAAGDVVAVLQGGLSRHPELPNVPLMQEVTDDPKVKKVLEFVSAGAPIGRSVIAPPDMPADRLTALRAAFAEMVKDPAFVADANKRGALLEPLSGEQVDAYSLAIIDTPSDVIEMAVNGMSGYNKLGAPKKK